MSDTGYKIRNQYGLHFLTFTVVGWVDLFTRKECRDIIIDSLTYCQKNKGLIVTAYCVMSNHLHLVACASKETSGLSDIVRDFKTHTSKKLIGWIFKSGKESRLEWLKMVFAYHAKFNRRNGTYQIWQQSNRPKECLHPKFTWQKIEYVHSNPVVAGIVKKPEYYVYSSASNYVEQGPWLLEVEVYDGDVGIGYVMT